MRLIDALTLWATGLVFSPMMWLGLILACRRRSACSRWPGCCRRALREAVGTRARREQPKAAERGRRRREMAEIEAILRKRGIT